MNLVKLEAGGVFDIDTAKEWNESLYFDGSNHISEATGSQWDHEDLLRSPRGTFVIQASSQRQGVASSWREVTTEEAAEWLAKCGHEIPQDVIAALPEGFVR